MDFIIKKVIIKNEYQMMASMMKRLQESEQEMNDKSAAWSDIEKTYMNYLINVQEENDGTCLVAYLNDKPIGFLFGYIEEQDESRIEIYKENELYISDGFVYPAYRKRGVYKQLNNTIEQLYINKGIRRITRYTLSTNDRMQNFLQKNGYQPTRILYEKWFDKDGETIVPVGLSAPKDA